MDAKHKKSTRTKTSSSAAKITSQLIAEHTNAFLEAGGKIVKIRSGARDKEGSSQKAKAKEEA